MPVPMWPRMPSDSDHVLGLTDVSAFACGVLVLFVVAFAYEHWTIIFPTSECKEVGFKGDCVVIRTGEAAKEMRRKKVQELFKTVAAIMQLAMCLFIGMCLFIAIYLPCIAIRYSQKVYQTLQSALERVEDELRDKRTSEIGDAHMTSQEPESMDNHEMFTTLDAALYVGKGEPADGPLAQHQPFATEQFENPTYDNRFARVQNPGDAHVTSQEPESMDNHEMFTTLDAALYVGESEPADGPLAQHQPFATEQFENPTYDNPFSKPQLGNDSACVWVSPAERWKMENGRWKKENVHPVDGDIAKQYSAPSQLGHVRFLDGSFMEAMRSNTDQCINVHPIHHVEDASSQFAHVRFLDGSFMEIDVTGTMAVSGLREQISAMIGVDAFEYWVELLHQGTVLSDSVLIAELCLDESGFVRTEGLEILAIVKCHDLVWRPHADGSFTYRGKEVEKIINGGQHSYHIHFADGTTERRGGSDFLDKLFAAMKTNRAKVSGVDTSHM